jgi:hypothetical protein
MAGSRIQCFLVTPTDRVERQLRRFVFSRNVATSCPGRFGYHNGHAPFTEGKCVWDAVAEVYRFPDDADTPPHDDPRWPAKCDECSYQFREADEWQLYREVIFVRPDTGETMTLRNCPPGAVWDAVWYPDKGPDGRSLCVALPPNGGDDHWHIDGFSQSGGKWSRTGTGANLTVTPSILTPRYHGFLTGGFLVECG